MRLALLAIATLAATADAAPCDITIVRAPDDVRTAIDMALASESCSIPLEVRILETGDGLYLLARSPDGRIHERTVPDAQSASLLIASWAADDGLGPAPMRAPRPLAAPSLVAPVHVAPPGDVGEPNARAPRPRWASFGAGTGPTGSGIRATFDYAARGGWVLGLAGSLASTRGTMEGFSYVTVGIDELWVPSYDAIDMRALAYGGYDLAFARWHLRATLGAGLVFTEASADAMPSATATTTRHIEMRDLAPTVEAALLLARDIGDEWGIEVGPVAAMFSESLDIEGGSSITRHALDFELVAAIRHPL